MRARACQNSDLQIKCNSRETIEIISANYGRTNKLICAPHGESINATSCVFIGTTEILANV